MTLNIELAVALLSFVFTLLVFSYLLGDNPLFRLAIYVFVGVSAGYAASVALYQVIIPRLFAPLLTGSVAERILLLVPLLLSLLLLAKAFPRLADWGSPAMALLVGVAAATAVGGAVLGTLFPQSEATLQALDLRAAAAAGVAQMSLALASGVLIVVGVVSTLVYFHFGARRRADGAVRRAGLIEATAWLGGLYIAIALGVLFAGVYLAALTALIERLDSFRSLFAAF